MVRKLVFVPGAGPRVVPRGAASTTLTRGPSRSTPVVQWVLLGVALAISAMAFSAAKRAGEPSSAAVHQRSAAP